MSGLRIYFAAERTLLAWIRTGITIMAMGFVVSRFALFIRLVANPHGGAPGDVHSGLKSDLLGVALVLLGSLLIILARHNHAAFIRSLPPESLPTMGIPWLSSVLAFALSLIGLIMAVYLAVA